MNKKIFDKLEISDQWSRYFKQYAHGSTVIEQLIHWISTNNNVIDNVNNWNDYLKEFVLSFDEKLQETVRNDMQKLQDAGFLDLLINEFINKKSSEIDNTLKEFNAQLEQTEQELNAQLQQNVKFYEEDHTKVLNQPYSLAAQRLLGTSKFSPVIIQQDHRDYTIQVTGNESTIEHIRLHNANDLPGKIGIKVVGSQRHHIRDLIIHGYSVGISMEQSYYNYLCDIFIRHCQTAILLGDVVKPYNWVGAMTFDTIRFNNNNTGIDLVTEDTTSSITLDKCSFEGTNHTLKNNAQLYVRNTYFGDQQQIAEDVNEPDYIVKARPGSKTYLRDSRMGMVNRAYSKGTPTAPIVTGVAILDGTDDKPCDVYMSGGLVEISNNNYALNNKGVTTLYTSKSAKNKVFVDDVDFIPYLSNENHNQIPYYLYDGFSCLASINPIKNYVINGNLSNSSSNVLLEGDGTRRHFDTSLTNAFGGKVLHSLPNDKLTFQYKIPNYLVGKLMVLEFYVSDCSTNYVRANRIESDCLETSDSYFGAPAIKYQNRTPKVIRINFTPTKTMGNIIFNNAWNAPGNFVLAGVCLKEDKFRFKLSCYEEATNDIYSNAIPTSGAWSVGDKVYNSNPVAGGYAGWICTMSGNPGTWKGFGLIED